MITKEIDGKVYKIKEEMNVKTWMKYSKIMVKLQKMSQNIAKSLNIDIKTFSQNNINLEEFALDADPELLAQLPEIEHEQFLVLYEGLVIEPKMTKDELEDLPKHVYDELSQTFTEIGTKTMSESRLSDLKKKQG